MTSLHDFSMVFCDWCSRGTAISATPEAYVQWAAQHIHDGDGDNDE